MTTRCGARPSLRSRSAEQRQRTGGYVQPRSQYLEADEQAELSGGKRRKGPVDFCAYSALREESLSTLMASMRRLLEEI